MANQREDCIDGIAKKTGRSRKQVEDDLQECSTAPTRPSPPGNRRAGKTSPPCGACGACRGGSGGSYQRRSGVVPGVVSSEKRPSKPFCSERVIRGDGNVNVIPWRFPYIDRIVMDIMRSAGRACR
jgi:hypothetical protein